MSRMINIYFIRGFLNCNTGGTVSHFVLTASLLLHLNDVSGRGAYCRALRPRQNRALLCSLSNTYLQYMLEEDGMFLRDFIRVWPRKLSFSKVLLFVRKRQRKSKHCIFRCFPRMLLCIGSVDCHRFRVVVQMNKSI